MNYIDRNIQIISEISQNVSSFSKGELLGYSSINKGKVEEIGNFNSQILDTNVSIALKTSENLDNLYLTNLLIIDALWENGDNEIKDQLPFFYGRLSDEKNNFIGEIMDNFVAPYRNRNDFSLPINGIVNVYGEQEPIVQKYSNLLKEIFGCRIDFDELQKSIFRIGDSFRIGDLESLSLTVSEGLDYLEIEDKIRDKYSIESLTVEGITFS